MLKDKVIITTGGAGLIGKEFVKRVANEGGVSIIADISSAKSHKVKEELEGQVERGTIDYINLDITSKESVSEMIETTSKKYGRIDGLINNAYPRNSNYGRKFEDVEFSDFCENINMNLGGIFLISQQIVDYFKQQGSGNIVNIASVYGVIAPRFGVYDNTKMTMPVEYSVIKSGLIHLTKYMAKYLKGSNIRINCISPGGIFDFQPDEFVKKYNSYCLSKGMLDKGDLAGTLVYLLSDMSKFVNGQNIIVDDGFSL